MAIGVSPKHSLRLLLFIMVGALASTPVMAEKADDTPLTVSFEQRLRFEALDNDFRGPSNAGDELLLSRTLIHAEYDAGPVALGAEFQDSRSYFADSDAPISASFVNAADILQLYARVGLPSVLGESGQAHVTLGRQTVSIGSKRQIERPSFANVIGTFTGAHFESRHARGDELHAFLVVPVARQPTERARVADNGHQFDKEQWNSRIWGLHYRRRDAFPGIASDIWGEIFLYGINEEDSSEFPTPNRRQFTPGFRLYRPRAAGRVNFDVEAAYRFGKRRASSAATDIADLDIRAYSLFARIGYSFDAPWQPNLALQYYYVSGDKDPGDGTFGQYERLFNSRRTDLNNTSIYGPLTPANLNAPSIRFEAKPSNRFDFRLTYSPVWLASDSDAWVVARLRDPTGQSGSFLGHAIDTRFTYDLIPDRLKLEWGASTLIFGEFPKNVPGGPTGNRTLFGYSQLTLRL